MSRHSIARSTLTLTGANLAIRAASLLFQSYLAQTIGPAGLGKLQLALTAGGFAMTLGLSGARVAGMNLTASHQGKNDPAGMKKAIVACLGYGLGMSLLAAALLFLLAPAIESRFLHDERILPALRLLALTLPVNCMISVLDGCYTARGKIRQLVAVEGADRLCSIGLTALLLRFWAGDDLSRACLSVVGGGAVTSIAGAAVLLWLLWRDLRRIPGWRRIPMGKPLAELCVPLALSDYLRSALSTLEQFLIPRGLRLQSGSPERAMADYGVIHGMVFPALMFPAALISSLSDVLVPELSRCKAQGDRMRIRSIVRRCLRAGIAFAAVTAALVYLYAPFLGRVLYHSETAGRYLRVFSPLILMLYTDALVDGMLKGLGEQVASVRYNTVTAAMDVALLFFLLPRWGLAGYFFSFTLTHAVNFYLSISRLLTVTGIRLPERRRVLAKN